MDASDKRQFVLGLLFTLLVLVGWVAGFLIAPTDAAQGQVYRIMYLHVPSAFSAFLASAILFGTSLWALKSRSETSMNWSKAAAEVGLVLTILTLATGSIWGRPTWGTWWTWDARLTTTFILALLYAGYLLLHSSMSPGPGRTRACAVLGILIFADVPIIYKSVTWWRTLHQPTDLIDNRGANMDSTMLTVLVANIVILLVYAVWLMATRARNLALRQELETASFERLKA